MNITHESAEETDTRLCRVLRDAEVAVLPGTWWFDEFEHREYAHRVRADAIALTRDGNAWSQLVPVRVSDAPTEQIRMWSVHFPTAVDNSGFVGWLATHIKRSTGSGVIVVCGQHTARGGIFDYWGCPAAVGDDALAVIGRLAAASTGVI